jgi:putative toxin-antitoxin system antitoxin component (TIGR02293 family)
MNAAALIRPPAGGGSPPGHAAKRRKLWNALLRKVSNVARLGSAHDAGHFAVANDMAHRIVREGVGGGVLVPLGELLEIGPTQLAPVLGVDRATLRRYVQNDQVLPAHSAETVLRLAEIEALALDVFSSEEAAHRWLKEPHPLLGESAVQAAATSFGAQRVREILFAIKYGGVV